MMRKVLRASVLATGAVVHRVLESTRLLDVARSMVRGGNGLELGARPGPRDDPRRKIHRLRTYAALFLDPPGLHATATTHLKGQAFEVDASEQVGRALLYALPFELWELHAFKSLLRPDDVVFDVGANLGLFSVLAAGCLESGRVHAFEPNPVVGARLRRNVASFRSKVRVHGVAVGDRSGSIVFHLAEDSAYSGVVNTGRERIARELEVPMWSLDDAVRNAAESRVDVIKADIEGFEPEFLEGGKRTLSAENAPALVIEIADPNLRARNVSQRVVLDRLIDFGYQVHMIEKDLISIDDADAEDVACHQNFLATKPAHRDRLAVLRRGTE
jgi:FkbM family methyltransferase